MIRFTVDYRGLLKEFIRHAYEQEGCTFVPRDEHGTVFTKQEIDAMIELEDESEKVVEVSRDREPMELPYPHWAEET